MSDDSLPLLKTKLYRPPPRTNLVSRTRLTKQLNDALPCKLILVSAPAGFGKTTLVSDWINGKNIPAAWLALDSDDNDSTRFITYLAAALRQIDPALALQTDQLRNISVLTRMKPIVSSLINNIVELNKQFVFVLEDYHSITESEIHETVSFIIEHMPDHMQLVINSRIDPPLKLSRLRARGQMTELRGEDLSFTEFETEDFLNKVMHLNLDLSSIRALRNRTEGWIAGLQLAAVSMDKLDELEKNAFVAALSGTDRYILDFLLEEVLNSQTREVKGFLLKTSILKRFNSSLCESVVGDEKRSVQNMLDYLDHNNLFLVPLDNTRNWYRYHHLFSDLLLNQLQSSMSESIPRLHMDASSWFEQHDLISEAIEHSLAADDYERAAELTEQTFLARMSHGEDFATMLHRLEALPEEIIQTRPLFGIWYAWTLSLALQLEAAETQLMNVEKRAGTSLTQDLMLQIEVIKAEIARHRTRYDESVERCIKVINTIEKDRSERIPQLQALLGAVFDIAWTYYCIGASDDAHKWFTRSLQMGKGARSATLTFVALKGLGSTYILKGALTRAEAIFREGLRLAEEQINEFGEELASAAYIFLVHGDLMREQNKTQEAFSFLNKGIRLCEQKHVDPEAQRDGYLSLARLKNSIGDVHGAMGVLEKAADLGRLYHEVPDFNNPTEAYRVLLQLANKPPDKVSNRWVGIKNFQKNAPVQSLSEEIEYLVWIRLLLAADKPQEALEPLDHMLTKAEENGRTGRVIEILVLRALAHQSMGEPELAAPEFERALSLAGPEGYVRLFLDEGIPMKRLLQLAQSRGIEKDYTERLLNLIENRDNERETLLEAAESRPIEPLSDREIEVLRLLETQLTGPEIADRLFISMNTLKTHMKNIYAKLDAHSRYEAVDIARKSNLIG